MMRGRVEVTNPDKVELTMTLTLPISQWRSIMRTMPETWPECDFANLIADAIGKTVGTVATVQEATS